MSRKVPRRSLDEIVTKYRLGKETFRDVYVEGTNDKALLDWYFRQVGTNAVVYNVDVVDVPDASLVRLGLSLHSARNRVIALASELTSRVKHAESIRFLIDRDQHDLCPVMPWSESLVLTDLGTLEISFLNEAAFDKLALIACRDQIDGRELLSRSYEFAGAIYLLRAAARRLQLPLRFLDPGDFIRRNKYGYQFDEMGFLDRCLQASGLMAHATAMIVEVSLCRARVGELGLEIGKLVNDHDLYKVLQCLTRHICSVGSRSADQIRDLMIMSSDPNLVAASAAIGSLV